MPLKGRSQLSLSVGQFISIEETSSAYSSARYDVRILKYFYELSIENREVLAFHWNPAALSENDVRFPHLHVGNALVAGQRLIRPKDSHKVHIPTDVISMVSVLHLAITEFGVQPLRANWEEIFERTERATESTVPG